MRHKFLVLSVALTSLFFLTNAAHAQRGGGHGGGGHGGGGHSHGGGGHSHGGHGHSHSGFAIGFGFYGPLYGGGYGGGYGYSYPSYAYSSPSGYYDYPYVAPRLAYYAGPQTDSAPVSTSASVRVIVPDPQAKVLFDGNVTKQEGTDRLFHTPSLSGTGNYRVRAIWLKNGKEVVQEAVATVRPGESTVIDFSRPQSEEIKPPKLPQ